MNNNNLNWSENRVVGNAGAAANKPYKETPMTPYRDTGPSGYEMPEYQQQGASPSTYQHSAPMPYQQEVPGMEGTSTRNDAYAPNPIFNVPGPPSVMDPGYIPGYLKTQIGKRVRAEFVFENPLSRQNGYFKKRRLQLFCPGRQCHRRHGHVRLVLGPVRHDNLADRAS
jgi:hypothetical protein